METLETVEFTIDPKLKHEADAVLENLGMDHSQAVALFYQHIIEQQGIPAGWLKTQE